MSAEKWIASTVSTVAGSAGPVLGTTWNASVVLSALTPNGSTLVTPSTDIRSVAMAAWAASTSASARAEACSGRVATAMIGPLTPGPNSSAMVV